MSLVCKADLSDGYGSDQTEPVSPQASEFVTLYVSYRQWFEIEYPDTESIPISIADVQPLHFATAAEAVEFTLIHCEDLTFYDAGSPQVAEFKAYLNRWPT